MRYLVNQHTGELEGLPSIPIASSEEKDMFLKGDGTYAEVDLDAFTGATGQNDGGRGTVPAPLAGDQDKVLQGNGSWGKKLQFDVVIQNGKYGYINANNEFVSFMSQADLSDVTGTLSIENGGTGATTAAAARTNLGLATVASSGSYADLSNKPTIPAKTSQLTNDSGFITQDATKLPLAGGTMTGSITFNSVTSAISYKGSKSTHVMIKFKDNANDAYGNGIVIGGGGLTVIGGGESADTVAALYSTGGDEMLELVNDGNINLRTNCQSGVDSAKLFTFKTDGSLAVPGSLTLGSALTLGNGGTGATTAANARTNLGVPPTSHASTATTYGVGNASNYGHVKVSDTYSGTANTSAKAANSIAASQWALQTAYNTLNNMLNGLTVVTLNNGGAWSNNASLTYNLGYNRAGLIVYQDQNGSGTLALKVVYVATARDSSYSRNISRTVVDAGNDFDTSSAVQTYNSGTKVGVTNKSGYTLYPKCKLLIIC